MRAVGEDSEIYARFYIRGSFSWVGTRLKKVPPFHVHLHEKPNPISVEY